MLDVVVIAIMVLGIVAEIALAVRMGRAKQEGDEETVRRYLLLVAGILFVSIGLNNIRQDDRVAQVLGVVFIANGVMCAVVFLRQQAKAVRR